MTEILCLPHINLYIPVVTYKFPVSQSLSLFLSDKLEHRNTTIALWVLLRLSSSREKDTFSRVELSELQWPRDRVVRCLLDSRRAVDTNRQLTSLRTCRLGCQDPAVRLWMAPAAASRVLGFVLRRSMVIKLVIVVGCQSKATVRVLPSARSGTGTSSTPSGGRSSSHAQKGKVLHSLWGGRKCQQDLPHGPARSDCVTARNGPKVGPQLELLLALVDSSSYMQPTTRLPVSFTYRQEIRALTIPILESTASR
ncbi:unnamed protein product [Protopolystoma xenopodis]|uniref:Uncharacterized protein n=1 Tax=Protopolystoma xenopodis TaxID=117903 RepID=A0A3S5AK09_9PLAT|nr:unnamed protein product [Protopolystoma xenopodis]